MDKYTVVDTNVLLNDTDFVLNNDTIILPIVLRELENLEKKRTNQDLLYRIRQAKRAMESSDKIIYMTDDNELNNDIMDDYLRGYDKEYGDNIILAYILFLLDGCRDDYNRENLVLYTQDILLGLKAKSFGITVVSGNDNSDFDYTGVEIFTVDGKNDACPIDTEEVLNMVYSKDSNENPLKLVNNQYLLFQKTDENEPENDKIVDILRYFDGNYYKINYKPLKNEYIDLKPINLRQKLAFDLMQNDDIKVKLIIGKAATGKDITIASHALDKLSGGEIDKIIWIGNSVSVKGTKDLGALPGDVENKIKPYYMVLSDILGSEYVLEDMIEREKIGIEYVGNLRSRTFNNAYIIVGECQNFTIEQLQLILGRVGQNSYIAFNGDTEQADISNSGLNRFIEALRGQDMFGCVELTDVERSEVARLSELLIK